ncbi:hypothetical protein [Lacinutrix sp. Hel_I_90]|uniref:hypothetical protein n=1 Tax=Lacinutrix sp. Hel_I_90 TaxID=1249999 RepID=UPI0005C83E87|nr:hypothetical protein [Lacinutrix sp. Hel_I_90]
MAVACATAFFCHETLASKSNELIEKTEIWEAAKAKRTQALNVLKDNASGTQDHNIYLVEKIKTDQAFEDLEAVIEKERFLQFKNLQQFLGEFGWASGLFLYSLFNLIITLIRKTKTYYGELGLHTTLLYISFFYLRWAFLKEDYSNWQYILTNLVCITTLIIATYYFVERKLQDVENLLYNIRLLTRHIVKSKPENNPTPYVKSYINLFKKLRS